MDVSFKGVKNIAATSVGCHEPKCLRISMQLTDDGEKDLAEFQDVFEKFPNRAGDRLKIDRTFGEDGERSLSIKKIMINGKSLKFDGNNSQIFAKLARLMKKIATSTQDFLIDRDYLENAQILHTNTSSPSAADLLKSIAEISDMHDSKNVKHIADEIFVDVDNMLKKNLEC